MGVTMLLTRIPLLYSISPGLFCNWQRAHLNPSPLFTRLPRPPPWPPEVDILLCSDASAIHFLVKLHSLAMKFYITLLYSFSIRITFIVYSVFIDTLIFILMSMVN